jgi:hypothetical protein
MNLRVQVSNADIDELLGRYIDKRLRVELGRFGDRVGTVFVKLNGSYQCRITTELLPFGKFAIDESGPELFSTIDSAIGRVGRRFRRELHRLREVRNGRDSVRMPLMRHKHASGRRQYFG